MKSLMSDRKEGVFLPQNIILINLFVKILEKNHPGVNYRHNYLCIDFHKRNMSTFSLIKSVVVMKKIYLFLPM